MPSTYTVRISCPHDAVPSTLHCTERSLLVLWCVQFCSQLVSFPAIKWLHNNSKYYSNNL